MTLACRFLVATLCASTIGCRAAERPAPIFELLDAKQTGIAFENRLPEDSESNILDYLYYYNGGGVAVGDINNDGLPDLYFTANLGPNRLYLNKGNYRFEDITERAHVAGPATWKSGVTMADVNGDGYVDIYVSTVGYRNMRGQNVLYINNRDGTFTDRTREYGLEFSGSSTQALFFDYDGDGDLDLFLLNSGTHAERMRGVTRGAGSPSDTAAAASADRLYRNDGGHFLDVSARAGLHHGIDFGLGVVASDFNDDGCPDLYVANDFQEDDYFYVNNCDGTFRDSIATAVGHTSQFSMGADAADVDNDMRPDIAVVDMLPDSEAIRKSVVSAESFDLSKLKLQAGYHPQFERNTLQLNRGRLRFSDIGFLAGVAATDWSWAPLLADFDNDGWKDLFVSDGIPRRPNDLDYLDYIAQPAVQAALRSDSPEATLAAVNRMPRLSLPNRVFRNDHHLTFGNVTDAWGLAQTGGGYSNGAVYVDLNNSGALDLVVNRINAPAAIYRNHAREQNGNHYLRVRLRGTRGGANTDGIGASVVMVLGNQRQLLEQLPTRGFQSSVDPRLHFGVGAATRVDSLIVVWPRPDRRMQVLTNVPVDQQVTLMQDSAHADGRYARRPKHAPQFEDVTDALAIPYKHVEDGFVDFVREPLMPQLLSREGPALAVGDVNGDGLDDMYVGGARRQPGRLLVQQRDGHFLVTNQAVFAVDSVAEDVDAVFFDANGDGHPDLYVVSGGNEFWEADDALQDRLYINDGRGTFHRDRTALPTLQESGSCVVVGDFNGDGHPDLFVGRRAVARKYGVTPHSYLLQNDGAGHFHDVADRVSDGLSHAGMVSSAAWTDFDGDGKLDLVVVGLWTPLRVFHQENGRFVDRTAEAGLSNSKGWWNTVAAADVNGDGRPDLIAGNLGLNSFLRASSKEPVRLYVGDFAHNGTLQPILTRYMNGVSYPVAGRDEILQQIPSLQTRFPTYASFAAVRVQDLIPASEEKRATILEATTFASAVAINSGKGGFRLTPLPEEAQFAPVYATLAEDIDGDGRADILVAGNSDGVAPWQGRYDASYGLLLHGSGNGSFVPEDIEDSGLLIEGQVRHVRTLRAVGGRRLIVVARNNDRLQVFRLRH